MYLPQSCEESGNDKLIWPINNGMLNHIPPALRAGPPPSWTPDHSSAAVEAPVCQDNRSGTEVGYDGGVKGHKRHILVDTGAIIASYRQWLTWRESWSYIIAGEN